MSKSFGKSMNGKFMTGVKDTSIIATGFTFQQLLENVNLFLSMVAGLFTVVYAAITALYAFYKLRDYVKQKKQNKEGK